LTLDFNVPYIAYRALFDYEADGCRTIVIQEIFRKVIESVVWYYRDLEAILYAMASREFTKANLTRREDSFRMKGEEILPEDPIPSIVVQTGSMLSIPVDHTKWRRVSEESYLSSRSSSLSRASDEEYAKKNLQDIQISAAEFEEQWSILDMGYDADEREGLLKKMKHIMLTNLVAEELRQKELQELAKQKANRTMPKRPQQRRSTVFTKFSDQDLRRDEFPLRGFITALRQVTVSRHAPYVRQSGGSGDAELVVEPPSLKGLTQFSLDKVPESSASAISGERTPQSSRSVSLQVAAINGTTLTHSLLQSLAKRPQTGIPPLLRQRLMKTVI
jgi:hypothetical protein